MSGSRYGEDTPDPRDDLLDIIPERLSEEVPIEEEPRRGRTILIGFALIGISVVGAAAWYSFNGNKGVTGTVDVPTIQAPSTPYKVRPANPGGAQIPNQDKTVYQRLNPSADTLPPRVEKLLPEPPLPRKPIAQSEGTDSKMASVLEATAPVGEPDRTEVASPPSPPRLEKKTVPSVAVTTPPAVAQQEQGASAVAPKVSSTSAPSADKPKPPSADASPGGPYKIQLAAVRDEAAARKLWQQTKNAYPSLLGGLKPLIQKADLGAKGIFYRVRATGLPSADKARAVCAALAKDKKGCLFVGQ